MDDNYLRAQCWAFIPKTFCLSGVMKQTYSYHPDVDYSQDFMNIYNMSMNVSKYETLRICVNICECL